MSKPDLKKMLLNKEFIVAPGVQDMMAALMAKEVGFDVIYVSGYWTAASAFGLPDSGIVTFTQMVDRLRVLCLPKKCSKKFRWRAKPAPSRIIL